MAETTQKLDILDQILDYRVVKIAGKEYEVRNPDALDPLDYRWFLRKRSRISELETLDNPSDEEKAEYGVLLERMTRMVLNAPEEIHASLNGIQRTQILLFFGNGSSTAPKNAKPVAGQRKGTRSRGTN